MSDQAIEQSLDPQDLMERLLADESGTPIVDDEPEVEPVAEAEEPEQEESDSEEQPEESYFTLTHNGQELSKSKEEVIALAQQGFDYTQKTQELAKERSTFEQQAQALKAQEQALKAQADMQAAMAEEIADIRTIDRQLAQYQQVNWQQLNATDPVQAQALWFQYGQLKDQREGAIQKAQAKRREVQEVMQKATEERKAKGMSELQRLIPEFNEATAASLQQFGTEMRSTILESFNPNDYKVLWMAQQFAKLQKEKPLVTQKLADKPPVVKPGGKDKSAKERSSRQDAVAQLRKTTDKERSKDLASKLIEGMI